MAISITLSEYLSPHNINYELIKDRPMNASLDSSSSVHLPTDLVVKVIILQSQDSEYLMATLPANNQFSITGLNDLFGKEFHLVNEWQLDDLSPAHRQGAIPNMGTAHKMRVLIDNILLKAQRIYIAAEAHRYLVTINEAQYKEMQALMPNTNIYGTDVAGTQSKVILFSNDKPY